MHAFDADTLTGPIDRAPRARGRNPEAARRARSRARSRLPADRRCRPRGRARRRDGRLGRRASPRPPRACSSKPRTSRRARSSVARASWACTPMPRIASSVASIRNCRAYAIERATALVLQIARRRAGADHRGRAAPSTCRSRPPCALRRARLARVLGIAVPDADVERILRGARHAGRRHRRRLDGGAAVAPLRHRDRRRPDRGSRPHPRLRRHPGARRRPARFGLVAPSRSPRADGVLRRAAGRAATTSEAINYAFVDAQSLRDLAARATAPSRWPIR